mgnify:FL=1
MFLALVVVSVILLLGLSVWYPRLRERDWEGTDVDRVYRRGLIHAGVLFVTLSLIFFLISRAL